MDTPETRLLRDCGLDPMIPTLDWSRTCAECREPLEDIAVEIAGEPLTCLRCTISVLMALSDSAEEAEDVKPAQLYDPRRLAHALDAAYHPGLVRWSAGCALAVLRGGAAIAGRGAHEIAHRILERVGVRRCPFGGHLTGNRFRPFQFSGSSRNRPRV